MLDTEPSGLVQIAFDYRTGRSNRSVLQVTNQGVKSGELVLIHPATETLHHLHRTIRCEVEHVLMLRQQLDRITELRSGEMRKRPGRQRCDQAKFSEPLLRL